MNLPAVCTLPDCQFCKELDPLKAVDYFLSESNAIEGVHDEDSLQQAKYAWDYLIEQPQLNGGVILKTHKILMLHQPLRPNERGYWRTIPIYIGGREGIDWHKITDEMAKWNERANLQITYPGSRIESDIKAHHVEYERIHPFVDGNGRTGRMFLNYQRLKAGLPLLVIHEENKRDYYAWFKKPTA